MGDCEEGFILKSEEELGLTFPSPSLPAPATDIAPSPHPTIDSDPILVPAPAPATDIAPSPEPVTEVATIPAAIDSDLDPYLVPDPATDIVPFPDPASDPATDIVAPSPDPATDLATTRAIDSDIDPASDPNLVPAAQETFYGEFQSLGLEENRIEKNNEEENHNDDKNENENLGWDSPVEEEKGRRYQHPQGTDEEVCPHYIRTGTCKFGLKCRFNHPTKRKNQEKEKGWTGKLECKYYLSSGGCKFGKACRYNHPREKTVVGPPQGLNFLGLPIRLGGKECPFYMRTGSCKYGVECRFNHPDPTAAGECDPPSVYLHSAGASQPAVTSWSSPRTSIDAVPHLDAASSYVPVMPSPPQGVHPNSEWNGYQAPAYPIERSTHPPSALVMNNPTKQADFSRYQQQQMVVEEFPERPGQPECRHFVRTGYCKFRSGCKFHHPKNPAPKAPVRSQ